MTAVACGDNLGKPIIYKDISRGMTVRITCATILPFCHLDKFPFSRKRKKIYLEVEKHLECDH